MLPHTELRPDTRFNESPTSARPDRLKWALTDEEVVGRVLAGDLPSFEIIVRRYNQRLFRIARSMTGEDSEAEDVVQETYVRAFEHLSQFEGRAKFSTWLTRIGIYEASSRRRRRGRMRPTDMQGLNGSDEPQCDQSDDAGQRSSMRELRDVLVEAVESLPDDLRTVFVLRAVEGVGTAEAADCLDLTESNVKVRLHRARAMLRNWIDARIGKDVRRLYQFDGERCDRIVTAVLNRLSP